MYILFALIIVVALLIFTTTKVKIHPFITLLVSAILMGFISGLDGITVVNKLTEGFGKTLQSIGIIIAFGTIIGSYLEHSRGAESMATSVLRLVGERKSAFAIHITGFIVSMAVFCDSGFIILSTLNKALSKKSGVSLPVLAIALATGLLTSHVFIPPAAGPLASAATIGADIGLVLIFGLIAGIPTALAGYFWAVYYGKKINIKLKDEENVEEIKTEKIPTAKKSFAPIIVPILLIALKSIANYPGSVIGDGYFKTVIDFAGNPVIALFIGVFIAFTLKKTKEATHFDWIAKGLRSAGIILLITGAGGAFGNVLRATDLNDVIGSTLIEWQVGIILPFIIAAVLKSAQGSSTVALITTAALISPLLPSLGLDSEMGKVMATLAISAGSMVVSHVNDSYFWVVSQFSNMDTSSALRGQSIATLLQGITGIIAVSIISFFVL